VTREHATPVSTKIQTVDELSGAIKAVITASDLLRSVAVRGEIQNFKRHSSGHVYFTLAGNESRIAAVLFRSHTTGIIDWPRDGDEILVVGNVDTYPKGGTYQLYATRIIPIGQGAQQRAREELRRALENEGLFDPRHKRPIPKYPLKVAVVTSPTGAAVRDILEVSSKRAPFIDIVIIPATVQGVDAPVQVTRGLALAAGIPGVDCVIVARGGGSKDDLSPFDDERIVRAVRSCPLPVITGVGHQIDSSLADLAADAFLPTPSAAAEKVFPDIKNITRMLASNGDILRTQEMRYCERYSLKLDRIREKLTRSMELTISGGENFIDRVSRDMTIFINGAIERHEASLSNAASSLDALSPLAVLARGYAICSDDMGNVIKKARALEPGARVSIRFYEGSAKAGITSVTPD
jgi:exodeoxyribonuclease VII large subunit